MEGINLNVVDYPALYNNTDFANFGWQITYANVTFDMNFTEWYSFWINAYNYMAVWMIYENACATDLFGNCKPLASIREIGEQQPSLMVSTVWNLKSMVMVNQAGSPLSLNDIEDNRLRMPPEQTGLKEDVRLHACIVCASISCPNLRSTAYHAETLEDEMDDNTRLFLANNMKGSALNNGQLSLSPIFSWFSTDFSVNSTMGNETTYNVTNFLMKFAPTDIQNFLKNNTAAVANANFFNYDWDLNGSVGSLCSVNRPCFPWWALVSLLFALFLVILMIVCVVKKRSRSDYQSINSHHRS